MPKTATLAVLTMASGLALGAECAVAGIQVPPVGTTLVYQCEGPWSKEYVDRIVWVKDGMVRTEGTVDGRDVWIEEPVFAFGLTLFSERKSSKGGDLFKQSFDIESIEKIADLEPGATFGGTVTEWDQYGRWTWRYDLSVGEPQMIEQPIRGKVEVIPVVEKRFAYQGSYSSEMTVSYEKESGIAVHWRFKKVDGEQSCDLVKME